MASANCLIIQSIKLRHREGKCLAQGHQGLELESKSEPRAPYLSFHLLLGPHLISVSISRHLCPTPDQVCSLSCPVSLSLAHWPGGASSWHLRKLQEPLRNRICLFISSPHYCLSLSPFPLPLSSIPGPAHNSVPISSSSYSVNQMDEPKGLRPEADRPRAGSRMEPSSRWKTGRHAAGTLRPGET